MWMRNSVYLKRRISFTGTTNVQGNAESTLFTKVKGTVQGIQPRTEIEGACTL